MALIDFTLSNARQFYSSMGNPLGSKGLIKRKINYYCPVTKKFTTPLSGSQFVRSPFEKDVFLLPHNGFPNHNSIKPFELNMHVYQDKVYKDTLYSR